MIIFKFTLNFNDNLGERRCDSVSIHIYENVLWVLQSTAAQLSQHVYMRGYETVASVVGVDLSSNTRVNWKKSERLITRERRYLLAPLQWYTYIEYQVRVHPLFVDRPTSPFHISVVDRYTWWLIRWPEVNWYSNQRRFPFQNMLSGMLARSIENGIHISPFYLRYVPVYVRYTCEALIQDRRATWESSFEFETTSMT